MCIDKYLEEYLIYTTKHYDKVLFMEQAEILAVIRYIKYDMDELVYMASMSDSQEEHDEVLSKLPIVNAYYQSLVSRLQVLRDCAEDPAPPLGTFIYESRLLEFTLDKKVTLTEDYSKPLNPHFHL